MATLTAIKVQNLRSLADTGWIEQKPITILVGKNSAGKSTFARVFPLLRQSAGEKKQSPILWFGQFVDFGEYSAALHRKAKDEEITFGFRLTVSPRELDRDNAGMVLRNSSRNLIRINRLEIEVDIVLRKGNEVGGADTNAKSIIIRTLGYVVVVRFSGSQVDKIEVDGLDIWRQTSGYYPYVEFDSLLPSFALYKERAAAPQDGETEEDAIFLEAYDPFLPYLYNEVRKHVHGNLGQDKIIQLSNRLGLGDEKHFMERAWAAGYDVKHWPEYIQGLNNKPNELHALRRAVLVAKLVPILKILDDQLSSHFNAVRYIEPLRATAQRYYRKQDLAVNEIDAKGANVAQFLQSLPPWRRRKFDELSKRLFGFTVRPHVQGGHIELLLDQTGSAGPVNMADAGVGFSQLLPILLQLWSSGDDDTKGPLSSNVSPTFVVEQPELHLHPAYQATLADLFREMAVEGQAIKSHIVAETHSPALINRLGQLVANGQLNAEHVQVLLFEPGAQLGETIIRQALFDSDGVLTNWPFGFFEPEV